jgi:hypothetical protein
VSGRIKPWLENAPLDLFWSNCIYLINSYLTNGHDVVFNYIINHENFNSLKNTFKEINASIFDARLLMFDYINSLFWISKYPKHELYNEILFNKSRKLLK